MNTTKKFIHSVFLTSVLAVVMGATASLAQTVWSGPTINYTQPSSDPTDPNNQDQLTGNVWLTRGSRLPMFNASPVFGETSYTAGVSPEDTEWAFGTMDDYLAGSLTFNTWDQVIGGGGGHGPGYLAGFLPNQPLVLHLITDDIYISIEFVSWDQGGGYSYNRSTPAVSAPAPTVSITSPADGSVFAAPADVSITASASVSGGSVDSVSFYANSTALGVSTGPTYGVPAAGLAAGSYALTAVATAAGISTTSSVVNISVVTPSAVSNTVPALAAGNFSFNYNVDVGLSYVVERSSDLTNWVAVVTNVATVNPAQFTESAVLTGARYYQVVRQPNP